MGLKINLSTVTSALAMATPFVTSMLSGKGAAYQKIASQAVRAAVTSTDNGVDKLVTSFTTFEASEPLVQTAAGEFVTLAKAAGFSVPELDAVQAHIKSAIYDLATAIIPADQLTAPATTASTASGSSAAASPAA
ncbi:hypothetical protein [Gluconobacter morbifer]|uniref:Phasin domain-containing protein n=1 Tax=Gluconobacter morbifer G707 TaxID=1088869 RepID=G6XKY6_9PROT|nr:hypothetical protein [Gluconobacter morbifer]EHH67581.1 hypothetical protein GMO_21520 [Gluconobacter morbifer G707]